MTKIVGNLFKIFNIYLLNNICLILILSICSVLGHYLLTNIDGNLPCEFNIYPVTKHGSVTLTHLIRRELADIKAPIRITVSYDYISYYSRF